MPRLFSLALAASLSLTAFAHAASLERLRGTIISTTATSLTLQTLQNQTETIQLNGKTAYATVTNSTLGAIQPGDFIGTAAKTVGTRQVALEVAIFPPAMRGKGEGHYAWDNIADTTQAGAPVQSSMTNGNVAAALPPRVTASSMTNGNVALAASAADDKQLTVTYTGGQQIIFVPPTAAVVRLAVATASVVVPGTHVFIIAAPGASGPVALFVTAGANGIKPPM